MYMAELLLSLLIGCCYAWGVDIIYTPGLNNFFGVSLITIMMLLQFASIPAINQRMNDYRKVVEFQGLVIVSATAAMFFFFFDKYSDMGSSAEDWQYVLPMVCTALGSIISILSIYIVREADA